MNTFLKAGLTPAFSYTLNYLAKTSIFKPVFKLKMDQNTPINPDTNSKAEKLIASMPMRWLEATGIILVVVGIFAFGGKYLDSLLGTHPWLFIAGIVIAFPLSQYLIYLGLKRRFK